MSDEARDNDKTLVRNLLTPLNPSAGLCVGDRIRTANRQRRLAANKIIRLTHLVESARQQGREEMREEAAKEVDINRDTTEIGRRYLRKQGGAVWECEKKLERIATAIRNIDKGEGLE